MINSGLDAFENWRENFWFVKLVTPLFWAQNFKNGSRGIGWLRMSFTKEEMFESYWLSELKNTLIKKLGFW